MATRDNTLPTADDGTLVRATLHQTAAAVVAASENISQLLDDLPFGTLGADRHGNDDTLSELGAVLLGMTKSAGILRRVVERETARFDRLGRPARSAPQSALDVIEKAAADLSALYGVVNLALAYLEEPGNPGINALHVAESEILRITEALDEGAAQA